MNNIPPEVKKNIEEQASMYADRYADRENFMIAYNAYLSGVLYAIEGLPKISSSVQGEDVVYVPCGDNGEVPVNSLWIPSLDIFLRPVPLSSLQPIPQRTYDESIKYWQSVIAFLNEYRDIVAPGCKENLFLSDFLARQLEAKFYKPIPEPVSVGEEVKKLTEDQLEVIAGKRIDTTSIPYEHGYIKGFKDGGIYVQSLPSQDSKQQEELENAIEGILRKHSDGEEPYYGVAESKFWTIIPQIIKLFQHNSKNLNNTVMEKKFKVIRVSGIAIGVGFEDNGYSEEICTTMYDTGNDKKDAQQSNHWAKIICKALNKSHPQPSASKVEQPQLSAEDDLTKEFEDFKRFSKYIVELATSKLAWYTKEVERLRGLMENSGQGREIEFAKWCYKEGLILCADDVWRWQSELLQEASSEDYENDFTADEFNDEQAYQLFLTQKS